MKIYCSHIGRCMGKSKNDEGAKRREEQQKICGRQHKELDRPFTTLSSFCLLIGQRVSLGR
jgi:hypothetical protein